jgi:hypothetical protein
MFIYKIFVPGEHDLIRTNFYICKEQKIFGLEKNNK